MRFHELFKRKSFRKSRFTEFFRNNAFGSEESVSGKGSTMEQTSVIRKKIPEIISKYEVKILMDAPCGDFNWMRYTDLSQLEKYIGLDIVDELVESNNKMYKSAKVNVQVKDICLDKLPAADLILCRDCIVHLSFEDGVKLIKNLQRSNIRYLLVTTFPERSVNTDLGDGIWRTLNMELPPFNFPKPITVINEGCTEDDMCYSDKSLGLYLLSEIIL
jgi:hypothetical protein